MTRYGKVLLLVAVLATAAACAAAARPGPVAAPASIDWAARLAEADALARAGHYTALSEAQKIYGEAMSVPKEREAVAERYLRAAIALELRKKQLGVLSAGVPAGAVALASAGAPLARYAAWLELVAGLPSKIKGVPGIDQTGGRTLEAQLDWVGARVPDIDRDLEGPARTDDLAASLRLALRTEFFFKFPDKLEPRAVLALHPDSRLVAFQAALSPAFNLEPLEALLALDPGFREVHYYIADAALMGGKVLTAEKHYLAALEALPDSLSVIISMAKVAFQVEETEDCLAWNEKALALLPTYRDALLGKGLSLGYLGRNDEALAVLGRLLELGTYYMGEGHYWTAWNLNELGRLEEAHRSIDASRVFLVGVSDVVGLAGVIAYRQGRLDDAEKDLREALDLDPASSDAAYTLGRLYADRKDWLNSAIYFAGAAMTLEDKEGGLEKKIGEIEASELAPERKARLVARKRAQIVSVQATKATCQYNAAAGYHNAGNRERALALAQQAAAHPAFTERAAELIKTIRGR